MQAKSLYPKRKRVAHPHNNNQISISIKGWSYRGGKYNSRTEYAHIQKISRKENYTSLWVAVISAKNRKRQRRKRQSVTAKREKSQTPKVLTTILTLPNLT